MKVRVTRVTPNNPCPIEDGKGGADLCTADTHNRK
jgi:hypothetical protein